MLNGVLDAGKRLVHFERLGDVLSELGPDIVARDAVQAREHHTLEGIDSKAWGVRAHT